MTRLYRVEPRLARRARTVTMGDGAAQEWVDVGRLAEDGPPKSVRFDLSSEHVLAIVGKRGAGKSFTLGTVLEGLCTREPETQINRISKERAVLLFDTLNIFQWMGARADDDRAQSERVREQADLLRRWQLKAVELDIDLWVPAGFEDRTAADARPFSIRTSDMAPDDWAALLGVDSVNDVMGQLVSQLHEKVTRGGWSDASGGSRAPSAEYAIGDLLECLGADPTIASDYARETRRAMRQRLSAYEGQPLFGGTGTELRELLKPGRLSVMLLSGIADDLRLTVVFLLIRKLLFARASASEHGKALELGIDIDEARRGEVERALADLPPKTWVVVDEAQNIFPSTKQTTASATLLRFVREGRNFGLSLAFTTQQPSAIDPGVMAQVDSLMAHTLTVDKDIRNVLSNLKSAAPARITLNRAEVSLADAIRALDVGQVFSSDTGGERGFFMSVRPRTSVHGGFEG